MLEKRRVELPLIQTNDEHSLMLGAENPCFSCGACCKNTWFECISPTELQLLAKNAPEVSEISQDTTSNPRAELSDQHEDLYRLDGLKFIKTSNDSMTVSLKGACSELGVDGKCQIYDQRPWLCAEMKVGGDSCNERRKGAGLPAIRPDGSLIPVETFRQRVEKVATKFVVKILPLGFGGGF
jgi:Fe-S-cluster containining protein